MDAEFCKYLMGTARFQALAEAFTKLLAANETGACRIIQDMLHAENVQANGGVLQGIDRKSEPLGGAMPPACGLDDPTWAEEKMQEFDKHEESRDYGTSD